MINAQSVETTLNETKNGKAAFACNDFSIQCPVNAHFAGIILPMLVD